MTLLEVGPLGVRVRELPAQGGVPPLRVYEPELRLHRTAAVLWVHAGGPTDDDLVCARMAEAHACPVISVDSRLVPAGLEDCYAALVHVLDEAAGFDVERLLVAGASAGAGRTVSLGLLARDRGVTGIVGLVCEHPVLDDLSRFADLRGLAPVFVDVGTLDPAFEEDVAFAHRLAHAGVPVELVVTPGASEQPDADAPASRRVLAARRDARQRMLSG